MSTRTVRVNFKFNDVLTDPTSIVLSDATATYGVKRVDNDAVVVAAGTAMTKVDTGQYEHTFTEPVTGLAYTAWAKAVYASNTYYTEIDIEAEAAGGLDLTYSSLRTAIGDHLGWTRTSGNWSVDEGARLDAILNAGYRQFLYPVPIPGEKTAHRWSFLKPTGTFDTVADDYLYDMPSDFGAIIGDVIYDDDEYVHRTIEQTSCGMIDRNRAVNVASGLPYLFALRPKAVTMTAAQVTEMMLYPTPDAAYGLIYHYDAKVNPLSSVNLYPLGGQAHSETLLQSCRDIASAWYKDDPGGREHTLFLERLTASVESDRRLSPKTLGFNEDGRKITHTRHGTEFSVSLTHNLGGGP